ncbi:lysophosphatidic acid phosphatase type 6-like, partial [Plectropomus leopardus]|uniref:lysophosphatidic acid phosphatase type 6-like n=1 Tax=Plectropomus leopardus TaxID=160734 RepID=UPI001C4DAE38
MRKLWSKAGVFGSVSVVFGSMLWSQKKTEPDHFASSCTPAETNTNSPYELKLVQVVFRHGARTPLKSIPDVMEAQWVPTLLEPPAHTNINYKVTDLHGGPRPPAPVEDSYRKNTLTV